MKKEKNVGDIFLLSTNSLVSDIGNIGDGMDVFLPAAFYYNPYARRFDDLRFKAM